MKFIFKKIKWFLLLIVVLVFAKINYAQKRYFYTNKPYGSEALFNPITLFINGGYDVCQLQLVKNTVVGHPYSKMGQIVFKNLGNPFTSISKYGW